MKIPTITAQGSITAETGVQPITTQAPLSMAKTLQPVQKAVADYATKERIIQDKTEALQLENESVTELNDVVFKASKMMNKQEANAFLKKESSRIRDKYRNRASSKSVQSIFDNNYLAEEQKQIYRVDGAVYKNIVQNNQNQKSIKRERIIAECLYSKNPLACSTLETDLAKLENEDIIQDDDQRAKNISAIPGTIEYFKAKKSINENPTQALKDVRNIDDGPYKNLPLELRTELEKDALTLARPKLVRDIQDHFKRLESGIDSKIDHKDVKDILGNQSYEDFNKKEKIILRTRDSIKQINNAKRGDEQKIIDNFIPDESKATADDLSARQKLIQAAGRKKELFNKDPAALVITTDSTVKKLYEDFASETDANKRNLKFDTYLGAVKQAQINMGVDNDDIKLIPNSSAKDMVKEYNNLDTPDEKIAYLRRKEQEYKSENFGILMKQLGENDLPMTARLVSYFGDRTFAEKALSFDSKEEQDRLNNFLKGSKYNQTEIRTKIRKELTGFRQSVMRANPYNTSKANEQLEQIEDVLYYSTVNELSMGKNLSKAVSNSTGIINQNFEVEDNFFIPKIIDGKRESKEHIQFIKDQAKAIKDHYVDILPIIPMESEDKTIPSQTIMQDNINQIKENGVWLNMANGDGLYLAIKFPNGEFGPIYIRDKNDKPKRVEIDFNNYDHKIKNTNIELKLKNVLTPPEDIGTGGGA